jgi:hypothetical protein
MSEEQFCEFCALHSDYRIERTAQGVRWRPDRVEGEGPVAGFVLDLSEFWDADR